MPLLPLLQIVLLGLEFDDALPEFGGLLSELVHGEILDAERLDADGEGDLLLFFQLLLGLVALQLGAAQTELLKNN